MLCFSVKLALMVASHISLFRKMRRFFAFSCKNDPESKRAAALNVRSLPTKDPQWFASLRSFISLRRVSSRGRMEGLGVIGCYAKKNTD
jgi:hypothetical protein